MNCKKSYEGGLYEARAFLCVRGLPLSLCWAGVIGYFCQNTSSNITINHIVLKNWLIIFLYFFFHYYVSFLPPPTMIVCSRNNCECRMKLCPEEKRKCFVKVTLKMIDILQLNKKRLSNFKTYYYVIFSLGQNIEMIFCKRRIGFTNFSGYYNRKRTRRWPPIFVN